MEVNFLDFIGIIVGRKTDDCQGTDIFTAMKIQVVVL